MCQHSETYDHYDFWETGASRLLASLASHRPAPRAAATGAEASAAGHRELEAPARAPRGQAGVPVKREQSLRQWLVMVAGDRRCHDPWFREHVASIVDCEARDVRVPRSLRRHFGRVIKGCALTTFSGRLKRIYWEPDFGI